MIGAAELSDVLGTHFEMDRINALGAGAAIVRERDTEAAAIALCVQLLRLRDLSPSGKWLYLQVLPRDALTIVASILSHAVEKEWPIDPDVWEAIQRLQMPPSRQQQ